MLFYHIIALQKKKIMNQIHFLHHCLNKISQAKIARFRRHSLLIAGFALLLISFSGFAQNKTINGFAIPTLAPKPASVAGLQQPVQSLNGDWNFKINTQSTTATIKVPGEWVMQGFTVNEGETAVYSRTINIPADWAGHQIKIRFDAVSSHALVILNGKKIVEHEGGFVPFEADITAAAQQGNNLLEVEVQAQTIGDRLATASQYAVHTVGGLLRKVELFAAPQTHVTDITVNTIFDKQFKNATLQINTVIANASAATSVVYTLRDAAGKKITSKTVNGNQAQTALAVPNAKHWNTESPYLYELTTELLQSNNATEILKQKVGFRQIEIKDSRVYVNGKPIKLRGVNRHSVHPLTGRTISVDLERLDAKLFRDANCNYIRSSHYPPSEEFLEACDELGLFVESETALCWIMHHASPIWQKWNYLDEKYLPFMATANIENTLAAKRHPSVILLSLGNESRWSPLWEKVNALVKQLDPTRPTVFHDQCWGGFNNAGSKADVANYHYPGINGPRATDTMQRPVLFGEYAHLSTYNRRELLTDPGVRSAYGAPLVQYYDSMYYYNKCFGGAIWSGIDDIFHLPDGRIVGYGPWGPIDAWRRTKPEYFGMKKAYAPVRIKNVDLKNLSSGFATIELENRFDFASLQDVKIEVRDEKGNTTAIKSNIAPHGKGTIKVPLPKNAKEFYISFTDPRGFILNEEKYELSDEASAKKETSKTPLQLSENESSITIQQNDITVLMSKTTGTITSIKKGNETLMLQGPDFAVIPMNSEDGGKPNVAGETYQNNIQLIKNYPLYNIFATDITAKQNENGVLVNTNIKYSDGSTAAINYHFTGAEVKMNYEITYKGNLANPYQYGLLMQLPKSFDKLSWDRKGDFTIYPENDIARSKGTAQLNAKQINRVEEWGVTPKGDWKDDANEFGSNDFRSTKHNIKTASLQNAKGNAITVFSDAKQASRSWLQDGRIQWLIADYCNNGSEPFYGTPFTEGRINIKDKTLKGTLTFQYQ